MKPVGRCLREPQHHGLATRGSQPVLRGVAQHLRAEAVGENEPGIDGKRIEADAVRAAPGQAGGTRSSTSSGDSKRERICAGTQHVCADGTMSSESQVPTRASSQVYIHREHSESHTQ